MTVKVFRPGHNRKGEPVYRPVPAVSLKPAEARVVVAKSYATWSGRKQTAIVINIPVNALLLFVGQMRYKGRPEARGIDSKTHRKLFGPGLRGFEHVRNGAYADPVHIRLGLVLHDPNAEQLEEILSQPSLSPEEFHKKHFPTFARQ